jgi:hypothetical protein
MRGAFCGECGTREKSERKDEQDDNPMPGRVLRRFDWDCCGTMAWRTKPPKGGTTNHKVRAVSFETPVG